VLYILTATTPVGVEYDDYQKHVPIQFSVIIMVNISCICPLSYYNIPKQNTKDIFISPS
jgi:hypothetical protein